MSGRNIPEPASNAGLNTDGVWITHNRDNFQRLYKLSNGTIKPGNVATIAWNGAAFEQETYRRTNYVVEEIIGLLSDYAPGL